MPSQHFFYLMGINMSGADVEASFDGATGSAGILPAAQSGSWAVGMDVSDLWMWLQLIWANLRKDRMINPAPGFWLIFGPLGPGRAGNSPGSEKSADCSKNQHRRPTLSPTRGHFVFLGPTAQR